MRLLRYALHLEGSVQAPLVKDALRQGRGDSGPDRPQVVAPGLEYVQRRSTAEGYLGSAAERVQRPGLHREQESASSSGFRGESPFEVSQVHGVGQAAV